MAQTDYYQLLGITKSSPPDEIKKSYRKLALQYHPDRNKTKEAETKFKEITKAYEVLSDPQKKQLYDQYGSAAFDQGGPGAGGPGPGGPFQGGGPFTYTYSSSQNQGFDSGGFSDPFEIFEQFFGGAGGPFSRAQRRPVYSLTITFDDAIKGVEKEVTIDGKKQKIKIPAGVDRGSRIRFENYDVLIDVQPHNRYQREGADIITEEEISFPQAVLGTQLPVETVQGKVTIKIPSGTQPGMLIRLSGKGMPRIRGGGNGDHYVKIKVAIPKSVTKRQKELLEEFDSTDSKKKNWF